jgi:hypothetical protein
MDPVARKVFVAQHPTEAHFVRGLLESDGIAAEIRGESIFGVRGEAPPSADTLPTVWVVDEGDAARAMAILSKFGRQAGAVALPATWPCPQCGESIESQFTDCWHCATSRPGEDPVSA